MVETTGNQKTLYPLTLSLKGRSVNIQFLFLFRCHRFFLSYGCFVLVVADLPAMNPFISLAANASLHTRAPCPLGLKKSRVLIKKFTFRCSYLELPFVHEVIWVYTNTASESAKFVCYLIVVRIFVMQALFKARFEQALDSQKLNIKKYEQELRRKGVNPEDPVAMASIQRVASTFFNAIDKKDGSPYVFHENKEQTGSTSNLFEQTEPGDDSDQEELDKFIADIEDAADKEWAEEEAAEKEEFGRIRYLNREHSGGRYRNFDMYSGENSGYDNIQPRVQRDRPERQMSDRRITSDSEEDDDDSEGDSNDVRNDSDLESDFDSSAGTPRKFPKPLAGRRHGNNNVGRHRELRDVKAKQTLAEDDSGTEDILSDLEDAMWKSDSDDNGEQEPERLNVGINEYKSHDEEEGNTYGNRGDTYRKSHQREHLSRGRNSGRAEVVFNSFEVTTGKPGNNNFGVDLRGNRPKQNINSGSDSSDSDIAMWESDDQEDVKVPKDALHSHQSAREEDEQPK